MVVLPNLTIIYSFFLFIHTMQSFKQYVLTFVMVWPSWFSHIQTSVPILRLEVKLVWLFFCTMNISIHYCCWIQGTWSRWWYSMIKVYWWGLIIILRRLTCSNCDAKHQHKRTCGSFHVGRWLVFGWFWVGSKKCLSFYNIFKINFQNARWFDETESDNCLLTLQIF